MKGKDYFKNLYGDIYKYFLTPYLCGTGLLKSGNPSSSVRSVNVEWELVQHVDGSWKIWLTTETSINIPQTSGRKAEYYKLVGETIDKIYKIKSSHLYLTNIKYISNDPHTYIIGNELKRTYIYSNKPFSMIEGHLSNFSLGWDSPIIIDFDNTKLEIRNKNNYEEIIEVYDNKFIKAYSVATVKHKQISYLQGIKTLKLFEIMLALLTTNSTFCRKISFFDANNIECGFVLNNTGSSYGINNNYLINPIHMRADFIQYFQESIAFFKAYQCNGIYRPIDYLLKTSAEHHIEFMMVSLILSLESACSFYFSKILNYSMERINDFDNIQQKLSHLNGALRFITSDYLSDRLREHVRNPLFHIGAIEDIEYPELLNIYYKYYDLLIRIIFRTIGYTGKYRSAFNNYTEKPV